MENNNNNKLTHRPQLSGRFCLSITALMDRRLCFVSGLPPGPSGALHMCMTRAGAPNHPEQLAKGLGSAHALRAGNTPGLGCRIPVSTKQCFSGCGEWLPQKSQITGWGDGSVPLHKGHEGKNQVGMKKLFQALPSRRHQLPLFWTLRDIEVLGEVRASSC